MSEDLRIKRKYFWLVIAIAGSAGVWLPIAIGFFKDICQYPIKDIPPNLTTYFLVILVSGCIDRGLKLFEKGGKRSGSEFMNIIIVICITFLLTLFSVLSSVFDRQLFAFIFSGVGVIFSIKIWWNVNIRGFENQAVSILGGEIK